MTFKVAVTSNSFSNNLLLKEKLLASFPDSKFKTESGYLDENALIDYLQGFDAVIVGLDPINENVLSKCPTLKIVSKYGVGLNNINQEACLKHNVKIGWTGGVNKESVAELTLGFMISLSRNINLNSNNLSVGKWNKNGGVQLSELTIGIIGLGHIGKELVKMLRPFKCKILVNDIVEQVEFCKTNQLITCSKDTIYKEADIVSLHIPLTDITQNLINIDSLKQMKPTSFLINTSRGGVVKENDLKKALKEQIIQGAAIDVYESEPPQDIEFLKLSNLICTPHIAGNSNRAVLDMGHSAIQHILEFSEE